MPKVRANGIELFYEESGTGEPLLLIAGFACDHTNWRKLVPLLASSYRLITFDNRGVGQSTSPATPYTIDQMAEDTIGLLDAIELNSVHIAGHSMGGQIALALAPARPERVKTWRPLWARAGACLPRASEVFDPPVVLRQDG